MRSEMERPKLISKINHRYQGHFQWMTLDTDFLAVMMNTVAIMIAEMIRVGKKEKLQI